MDDTGGGGGAVAPTTGIPCGACGTNVSATAKFCSECGAPVTQVRRSAEYKQVTVLFADVVHSMDIAAAVGAERLREIMTELVDRSCSGGTSATAARSTSFTGDGIMAVFGAPQLLEDHAVRACLAALGVQQEAEAAGRQRSKTRDGVDTASCASGLNSGQVIAGEIGSEAVRVTPPSVSRSGWRNGWSRSAPPGGVMLSAIDSATRRRALSTLGEPEMVSDQGQCRHPVRARRLLASRVGAPAGAVHAVDARWGASWNCTP